VRDYVRSLPVFADVIRDFDADSLPDVPADLFGAWLRAAVEDGIPEPHA
jgi:pyridoxamine 5'-phosphate oxidase